jgi:tetratricopeptide (TPR) repeat protein
MKAVAIAIGSLLLTGSLLAQTGTPPDEAGWKALQAGNADQAATYFLEALRRNPRDAASHFGAGAAAHMQRREDDAIVSLKRALALNARLTGASELLGLIQYQQGDIDEAIRTYEAALTSPGPADTTAMRTRLDGWRKEAAVHSTLATRNDARFSITFNGRSDPTLASRASAVLERAFWTIGQKLGAYPSDRILVTLYTEEQFRDITNAPAWSGGVFDGRIRIPVKGAEQNLEAFGHVLVHELTHAMIHGLAPRGVPAWLHEGLASYFEPRDPAVAEQRMRSLGIMIPLDSLSGSFGQLNAAQATVAYAESLCAADLLLRLANGRVSIVLQGLGSGQSLDASLGALGLRAADFEAQLGRRLRR